MLEVQNIPMKKECPEFVRKTDLQSFSGTFSGQWKCPEFVQLICWTIITFIIQSFAIKLVS